MFAAPLRRAHRCVFLKGSVTMATGGKNSEPGVPRYTNRLISEKSPYLLQHAHNPVDWYPWGQEAFDKAKKENKLIFLSVGYSTCHWCHVMEEESFKNREIGEIMNKNFVCIKVDREERPDVDKVYMTFVQATSGGGGWPMSVWLTPDLKPFAGGTYFPPDDRVYRIGFRTVLLRIAEQWKQNKDALLENSQKIMEALLTQTEIRGQAQESPPPSKEVTDTCFQQLSRSYDEEYGGFSEFPKFPTPVNLNFLFTYWALHRTTPEGARALQMALHTLKMMAYGGIHDHIGQGFHRYSTDQHWHVPHFEKMLYDQGQLAAAYTRAFQISGDEFFADVAGDILLYVSRDLSDQAGGFYSAEDADSYPTAASREKREGAFCVWTAEEIRALLPDPVEGATEGTTLGDVFMHHYGVKEDGNVSPAKPLLEPVPVSVTYVGLMISGFAQAGATLAKEEYVSRAVQAANFLRRHLFDPTSGKLLRSCYRGKDNTVEQSAVPIQGFLEDYVFVIQALFDLYEASLDQGWLEWALQLQHTQDKLFWDPKGFAYFYSEAGDPSLLLRLKDGCYLWGPARRRHKRSASLRALCLLPKQASSAWAVAQLPARLSLVQRDGSSASFWQPSPGIGVDTAASAVSDVSCPALIHLVSRSPSAWRCSYVPGKKQADTLLHLHRGLEYPLAGRGWPLQKGFAPSPVVQFPSAKLAASPAVKQLRLPRERSIPPGLRLPQSSEAEEGWVLPSQLVCASSLGAGADAGRRGRRRPPLPPPALPFVAGEERRESHGLRLQRLRLLPARHLAPGAAPAARAGSRRRPVSPSGAAAAAGHPLPPGRFPAKPRVPPPLGPPGPARGALGSAPGSAWARGCPACARARSSPRFAEQKERKLNINPGLNAEVRCENY
ncbi:spermatogenesis-associated protein 20 isoform X3 [Rhea pennata]|uniref:spermatogenesis-associated protein 20 isoform X3 n=1 Tax=Rhea pennata TaxID=8795 RepID=UPI002E260021